MSDPIKIRADVSISKRSYLSGQETRYYILTIKLNNDRYLVKVLEQHSEIVTLEIDGRLVAAKKEGIRTLLRKNPSVDIADVTMVHYKDDRPNGRPWQRDSEKVIKQLLALESTVSLKGINYAYLDETLKKFHKYRENHEEEYQASERRIKDEIVSGVGPLLRKLEIEPQRALDQLIQIISGQDKDRNIRHKLQKLFKGPIWLDDFLVLLQHSDLHITTNLLQDLINQGITEEVRNQFGEQYSALLEAGMFSNSKKKVETPNQFLAMLLASYSPDEYVLYRPNDFGPYVDRLGLVAPSDVVERYALYNQVSHLILEYAKDKRYNVQDLMDAYHVVYLTGKYTDFNGGVSLDMESSPSFFNIVSRQSSQSS